MNLADLVEAKRSLGYTISVCLPARNEAATIGEHRGEGARASWSQDAGLVDEIVVLDDGSTDATAAVARAAGATRGRRVRRAPRGRAGIGQGQRAVEVAARVPRRSVCWLDADLRNFDADTVTRLVEPLLTDSGTVLVKASYTRSFEGAPTGGGRVTELVARPLVSLLFPKLADIVQPLGGEYAARRDALEVLPFVEGWGVELGLLVDVVDRFGRDAVAQVDLGTREHRNRPVDELAAQSLAIIATALRRAGSHALRRARRSSSCATTSPATSTPKQVEIRERPPITTIAAYRAPPPPRANRRE